MNPITHFLVGWTISLPLTLERRDRCLVVLASVAPDLDGMVILGDLAEGRRSEPMELWSRYHHLLAHNLGFALLVALGCWFMARRKLATGALALLAVHLHFLCDVVGSRGPDGYQWPVPYLLPFSNAWQLAVDWQWALNAWPNVVFTAILLALTLYMSWVRGFSPVGLLSERADRAFVAALRGRFGPPVGSSA